MDESVKLIFAAFGAVATILLGVISAGVINIAKSQSEQNTKIQLNKKDIDEIKTTLVSLHKFRNELMAAESQKIIDENTELKKELHGRRGYDNV